VTRNTGEELSVSQPVHRNDNGSMNWQERIEEWRCLRAHTSSIGRDERKLPAARQVMCFLASGRCDGGRLATKTWKDNLLDLRDPHQSVGYKAPRSAEGIYRGRMARVGRSAPTFEDKLAQEHRHVLEAVYGEKDSFPANSGPAESLCHRQLQYLLPMHLPS